MLHVEGSSQVPACDLVAARLLCCRWWIVGGLGARGLVYHAWLGKLLAQAVLQGSDTLLPIQLLRWKP